MAGRSKKHVQIRLLLPPMSELGTGITVMIIVYYCDDSCWQGEGEIS